jgi:hypothetical protein
LLSDPDKVVPLYKLEIFNEALCPYISVMQSRMVLSGDRLPQLLEVLLILDLPLTYTHMAHQQTHPQMHTHTTGAHPMHAQGTHTAHYNTHPATALLAVEGIVRRIDSTPSWYRSELSTKLGNAVSKQWVPILGPMR